MCNVLAAHGLEIRNTHRGEGVSKDLHELLTKKNKGL